MAGIKPGFVTGANAKIRIGINTIAYATNISYDINVQTIPIEAIGKYEAWSNEPVSYSVNGSFSIIRYTARASGSAIPLVNTSGNAPAQVATGTDGNMAQHLSPGDMLASETFDMTIYDKGGNATAAVPGGVDIATLGFTDCRITRRSGNLDKRGVLMDQYTFVGILAGDSLPTGISGTPSGTADIVPE